MSRSTTLSASVRLEDDGGALRSPDPGAPEWRGAQLLVGALAHDYAGELAAAAARLGVALRALEVTAGGHLTTRRDGRSAFVALELDAAVDAAEEDAAQLRVAAEVALDRCAVAAALDVPLSHRLRVERRTAAA